MSGKTSKQSRRITLVDIAVTLDDGNSHVVKHLDIRKVMLVDKETHEPLFKPVVDARQVKKSVQNTNNKEVA